MKLVCVFLLVLCLAHALSSPTKTRHGVQDLETAATGYGSGGQVHIEVHRGPTKKHGYDYFAPFSYYVRQPEDYHVSHYKGGYH